MRKGRDVYGSPWLLVVFSSGRTQSRAVLLQRRIYKDMTGQGGHGHPFVDW